MVHCHLEDGELVQPARHRVAGGDHLGQLRHVAVHALSSTLLHLTVLVAPEGGGGGGHAGMPAPPQVRLHHLLV